MEQFGFTRLNPESIEENLIHLIEDDWMLVTAGTPVKFNTMTANWGGTGYLWNKQVVFVFIRPERFTYGFTEDNSGFTLTFFGEDYRDALRLCGSKSGRDIDKVRETGLTPIFTGRGYPAFKEAKLILECRKLYGEMLKREAFIDTDPLVTHYSNKLGIHKMYIAEIEAAWTRGGAGH